MFTSQSHKQSKLNIPFEEKITLSAFQKYKKYDRFPWKFVLSILLALFASQQILMLQKFRPAYQRNFQMAIKSILISDGDPYQSSNEISFYNVKQFQEHIQKVQKLFSNLDGEVIPEVNLAKVKYQFDVYYTYFEESQIGNLIFDIQNISNFTQPFDPSNQSSVQLFLRKVNYVEFYARDIKTYLYTQAQNPLDSTCFLWKLYLSYNVQPNKVNAVLRLKNDYCVQKISQEGNNLIFLHTVVFILSSISSILSWKYIYKVITQFLHHKKVHQDIELMAEQGQIKKQELIDSFKNSFKDIDIQYDEKLASDKNQHQINQHHSDDSSQDTDQEIAQILNFKTKLVELTYTELIKLCNFYIILSLIGNLFTITGTIASIIDIFDVDVNVFERKEVILGFGAFFQWIVLLNYLKFNENLNLMNHILKHSATKIMFFFIACLPFFLGFSFLCEMIFFNVHTFTGTLNSSLTLFSAAFGDSIADAFGIIQSQGVIGKVILMVYILLFFTSIQNIFIAIIMEGFKKAKHKQKQKKQKKLEQNFLKTNSITIQQQNDRDQLDFQDDMGLSEISGQKIDFNQKQSIVVSSSKLAKSSGKQENNNVNNNNSANKKNNEISNNNLFQLDIKEQILQRLQISNQRMDIILDEFQNIFEEIKENLQLSENEKISLQLILEENLLSALSVLKFKNQQ